jgi:uncharacterized protein
MSVAIESTLPGVIAIVNANQVARPFDRQPTSTAFIIGLTAWGPIGVPTVVTSFADYMRQFGGYHPNGYVAETANIFFNQFGGKQMIVCRVSGGSPVKGSTTFNNTAPTPVPTFKFEAKYASQFVDISVQLTLAGNATVKVVISSTYLNSTETYNDVDLRIPATVAKINAESKLISLSLVAPAVAGVTGRPASSAKNLMGGDDDSANLENNDYANFVDRFNDETLGTGQVSCPGVDSIIVATQLAAHAEQYQRLAVIDVAFAQSPTSAISFAGQFSSSHAAVYYPWVQMKNLSGSGNKYYPPSIFAVGACAYVDRTTGTHQAPANIKIPLALDVERNSDGTSVIDDGSRALLNAKHINVITPFAGEVKIYGERLLYPAGDTRVRFVHERRVLNLIYYTAKIGYRWAVFAPVGDRLFRDLVSSGKTFLRNLWNGGALHGKTEKEAFVVIADETNNQPDDLANGQVHVQFGVKLSSTAEQIIVNIDNVPLSQDLSVLQN